MKVTEQKEEASLLAWDKQSSIIYFIQGIHPYLLIYKRGPTYYPLILKILLLQVCPGIPYCLLVECVRYEAKYGNDIIIGDPFLFPSSCMLFNGGNKPRLACSLLCEPTNMLE